MPAKDTSATNGTGEGPSRGLQIDRHFTAAGEDPYSNIEWSRRDSKITNPDGSVVFEMKDAEIPASFSQVAADIMVSKYFRKAGVPQKDKDGNPIVDFDGKPITGPEQSAKDVFNRLAETWRWWGENYGYFDTGGDAQAFEDELKYMLANQMAAPNSPQWFNTGLAHKYGITGTKQGFWFVDEDSEELEESPDAYSRPAPHACFPAGTRIMTAEGFTPIEKIEPGDLVVTHEGHTRPVREIMQRPVDEALVTIRVEKLSATPLVATANHPVLTVRNGETMWIDAGQLRPGDFVVIAGPDVDGLVPSPIDLATELGPNFQVDEEAITTVNAAHKATMFRSLDLTDPALMRLLGRWLGDGSIGHESRDGERASVNFVFDAADSEGIEDVQTLMRRFFGVSTEPEYANGQRTAHLRYIRRPLARWFGDTFGEGFAHKSIPGWVYDLPAEHRLQLLVGLFQSDGGIHRAAGFLGMNFDQSNQDLAEGIWRVGRSLGYGPSLSGGSVRPERTTPHFRVQMSAKDAPELASACGLEAPAAPSQGHEIRLDGLVAYRVTGVDTEPFYGTVYNFQVEDDESYVANGVVVHNCFIQAVNDDLVNPGGIMDLWVREARLFKMGSGTGSNFSHIRSEGEPLAGGGRSSGLMSFLKIGDRAAGAIKSGGTTRRAAKMVILDIDHPDIEEFIAWKKVEEDKARILIEHGGFAADFNGEAYATVSGQNSNNSVRVTNDFIQAVLDDGDWSLTNRLDGSVRKTIKARDLWRQIAEAAWACADPGMQYHTTINEWHTSPAGGEIRASNPCSEYMFLDNTACNLASLNLVRFTKTDGTFDIPAYEHAIRIWTVVLEISVTMAHFPSAEIAQGSYDYRTLGLGYANLGSLLMRSGIPYDSDEGRAIAGALTSTLTGIAYAASAEMAAVRGPFPKFTENRNNMLRVMRNHRRAAYNESDFEGVNHSVMGIDPELVSEDLLASARGAWDKALELGETHGYRNAQATVLAPTGCLVGGSLVSTDRGLVRLGSLGDPRGDEWQDLGVQVSTDEGPREATQFYINGVEPVVTVETARGYRIQGTPTHRIKVVDPQTGEWMWRRFGDIESEDLVPLQMHQLVGTPNTVTLPPLGEMYWTGDFTTIVPREMTAELAELVGYFMGDGSLHAKGLRFCVATEDCEVVERLGMLGKQLFNLEAHTSEQTGYTEVAFHSVPLTTWWEACGFAKHAPTENHVGKGYTPHIPDAVLHSNDPAVYQAFIRGLFEADGYAHSDGYAMWSSASLEFSHDVQSLLLALGYPTTRRMNTPGWGSNDVAELRILNQAHSARWAAEIGFISGRKQAGLMSGSHPQAARKDYIPVRKETVTDLTEVGDDLRNTMLSSLRRTGMVTRRSAEALYARTGDTGLGHLLGFYYDRVAIAELGEEQYTYDLSVPDNVTYVANGFVSHNTIGLLMDCDTTGVEPDFALVKFKKLAGGGYFKIANQSIAPALNRLGYTPEQISDIIDHVVGTSTLLGAPHVNRVALTDKGFTAEEIGKIEEALPSVFELKHAFNVFVVGEDALQRLGFTADDYTSFDFDLLAELGFSNTEVSEANDYVCGRQTIEGAPHLADDHLAVFDCANRNGKYGERFIHHTGHIKMMAAAQPFISGAISKTINMPNEVSIGEVAEAYMMSWELGIKAMALYRDGSKASQPLSASSDDGEPEEEMADELVDALEDQAALAWGQLSQAASPTQAYANMPRPRFLLPARRAGFTQEARVGGHKVYLRTGEYEDGTLGEIFIDLAKEGATLRGVLASFAIAVSKGLQYGVPLEEFVDTFVFQTFEPRGMVEGHPNIKMANSIIDYMFRALGVEYLHRDELVQVPPDRTVSDLPAPPKGIAAEAGQQLALDEAAKESDIDAQAEAAAFADGENGPTISSPSGGGGVAGKATAEGERLSNGPGAMASQRESATVAAAGSNKALTADLAAGELMGDAPACSNCGHMTVRNGSCYVCLTCGDTTGCS